MGSKGMRKSSLRRPFYWLKHLRQYGNITVMAPNKVIKHYFDGRIEVDEVVDGEIIGQLGKSGTRSGAIRIIESEKEQFVILPKTDLPDNEAHQPYKSNVQGENPGQVRSKDSAGREPSVSDTLVPQSAQETLSTTISWAAIASTIFTAFLALFFYLRFRSN